MKGHALLHVVNTCAQIFMITSTVKYKTHECIHKYIHEPNLKVLNKQRNHNWNVFTWPGRAAAIGLLNVILMESKKRPDFRSSLCYSQRTLRSLRRIISVSLPATWGAASIKSGWGGRPACLISASKATLASLFYCTLPTFSFTLLAARVSLKCIKEESDIKDECLILLPRDPSLISTQPGSHSNCLDVRCCG